MKSMLEQSNKLLEQLIIETKRTSKTLTAVNIVNIITLVVLTILIIGGY